MENRITFPQAGGLGVYGDLHQDLCDITAGLCDIGYCPNGRRQWRNCPLAVSRSHSRPPS